MGSILADIRYALRQLRKSPGFAATAILTLALGIGATTAIFTLVYQVMLRSMPVEHPEQLYKIGKNIECCVDGGLQDHWRIFSTDLYRYMRDQTPGTAGFAAVDAGSDVVSVRRAGSEAAAQPLAARFVSGNYFSVVGVKTYSGRLLTPDDDRAGAAPVAVISYTLWQTKFGGDPRLLGSTLLLSGHPATVVGIGAKNFIGERNAQDPSGLWLTLAQEPVLEAERPLLNFPSNHWLDVLVRIPNPADVNRVQLSVQGALHQWIGQHASDFGRATAKDLARQTTELASAAGGINDLRDQYEKSLRLLFLVAGFVLLIACANLANLMLVRGMARQQELAVRTALGAPRVRLIRQMLVESIVLACLGGVAALIVAFVGTRGILALAMKGVEVNPIDATPSLPVLGFALLLSLLTGILFGIVPAWITSRSSPVEALRGANRSTRDASARPQKVLVILQAALSLVLLTTAGLLITSLRALEHQDFHFQTHGRLVLGTDLRAAGVKPDRLSQLYGRMDDVLGRLPGVQKVAYATYSPMVHNNWSTGIYFPGGAQRTNQDSASYSKVSPHYFEALGARILLGRGIEVQDTPTSAHVAVVNQVFVHRFLKDQNPIGQHFGPDKTMGSEFVIVGVTENSKYGDPGEETVPMYLTPIVQTTTFTKPEDIANETFGHYPSNIVVQYQGDEASVSAALRRALKEVNPDIPILSMKSYDEQLADNFTQQELVVRLTSLFGLLALLLAAIGIYGITAYSVARRTSEIGLRMALGATREGVLLMVVKTALVQALIGLAVGLPLTFASSRIVQSTLYQTSAFQPQVLLVVAVLLLAAALAAAAIPARRAASIDPMRALRTE